MHRGDDPSVRDMSLYIYSLWVYRVELEPHARTAGDLDAEERRAVAWFGGSDSEEDSDAEDVDTENVWSIVQLSRAAAAGSVPRFPGWGTSFTGPCTKSPVRVHLRGHD